MFLFSFQELQKEIEIKGKCIASLLKLCDHLKGNVQIGQISSGIQWDSEQVRKVAHNLERKWHSLWLESLQDTCILEDLIDSYATVCYFAKSVLFMPPIFLFMKNQITYLANLFLKKSYYSE